MVSRVMAANPEQLTVRIAACMFLVLACGVGCRDSTSRQTQFEKRYAELGRIYLSGDIHSADKALSDMERLVSIEGRTFFAPNGLRMELALLRARRSQLVERQGDHGTAQQLMGEALSLAHQAGKNTNGGTTELLEVINELDENRQIRWKQGQQTDRRTSTA